MTQKIFLSLLLLATVVSCRKDLEETEIGDVDLPQPKVFVKAGVSGEVRDIYGNPVSQAKVYLGNETTTTDNEGNFFFRDKLMLANAAYVRVEHPYYFHASRTMPADVGTINTVHIRMITKISAPYISAKTGGTISTPDFDIILPAGAVATPSAQDYDGEIAVFAHWLDPIRSDFVTSMPGHLTGTDANGRFTGLISMSMLAVELATPDRNPLKIKTGRHVTLRMRVPDALLSKAPKNIPLWYFDETAGYWKAAGTAQLNGNFYEGRVGQLSYWSCNYPTSLADVALEILDQNDNPLPFTNVAVKVKGESYCESGHTNEKGIFRRRLPKNTALEIEVHSGRSDCPNAVFRADVGSISKDGRHSIRVNSAYMYEINGRLTDCQGKPLSDCAIKVDTTFFHWQNSVTPGNISFRILSCQPVLSIGLWLYDMEHAGWIMRQFKIAPGKTDMGDVKVCSKSNQTINYTFGNQTISWIDFSAIARPHPAVQSAIDLHISGSVPELNIVIKKINGAGYYTAEQFRIHSFNNFEHKCLKNTGCLIFYFEKWNGVGKYTQGIFGGQVEDETGKLIQVKGNFNFVVN